MNNNYKRQLQEAHEQGYYQQLDEIAAIKGLFKGLWRLIRGQADNAADAVPPTSSTPDFTPGHLLPDSPTQPHNVLDWLNDNAHEDWVQDILDEVDEIDPYTTDVFHLGPATSDFDMGRGFKQDDVPWNPIRWN